MSIDDVYIVTPKDASGYFDNTIVNANSSRESDPVDMRGIKVLAIFAKNGGPSNNLDVLIYGSYAMDGEYDNKPYFSMNLGNGDKKTQPVTIGPPWIKVKLVNNDTSNSANSVVVKLIRAR